MVDPNFRKFTLTSGREIIAGKDSAQNDVLVDIAKRRDVLLHTKEPGSPFVNVGEEPSEDELYEAAIFCALKSQDFRDWQTDVKVNSFYKDDCYKDRSMKSGTWGVSNYIDTIVAKKIDILRLQHDLEVEQHGSGD